MNWIFPQRFGYIFLYVMLHHTATLLGISKKKSICDKLNCFRTVITINHFYYWLYLCENKKHNIKTDYEYFINIFKKLLQLFLIPISISWWIIFPFWKPQRSLYKKIDRKKSLDLYNILFLRNTQSTNHPNLYILL